MFRVQTGKPRMNRRHRRREEGRLRLDGDIDTSRRWLFLQFATLVLTVTLCVSCATDHRFITKASFEDTRSVLIRFAGPVDRDWAENPDNFSICEKPDPDIQLTIDTFTLSPDRQTLILSFAESLNQTQPHILKLTDIRSQSKLVGTAILEVRQFYLGYLFSILIGAMIINNFVFTKYLGLCVFFGTSQKKSTAIGMGVTFTAVIVVSAMLAWFLYQCVLKPYRLDFLQVVVFIGLVSLSVQAVDTILRKVNPLLFKAFGAYLVLVISNCVILAVPLMLADHEYNAWESLMLALGAGTGFLIALFLMASVRERLELANVPPTFRGLPIAFVLAGLFALAFLGFSGMTIF